MTPVDLFQGYNPPKNPSREVKQQKRIPINEAIDARILRSLWSTRQLQEVMVDFWFNHFNVYGNKGLISYWIGNYENQAIRPHVFGKFRDLLGATAHHPAMLFYLDNFRNNASKGRGQNGNVKGLNENYARELLELHTLGVDGGYTQTDVITLARILTGWTIDKTGKQGDKSGFYFNANGHDSSDKVFLGVSIRGGGIEEGEQALDILARHPSTARHISYRLAQYFLSDNPPESLVNRLREKFLATDGDLRTVMETLLKSPEFNEPKYFKSKFKTPYQYVISLVRMTEINNPNVKMISSTMRQLDMPLYGCLTPNGYPNTQDLWLNPDAVLRRLNWIVTLTQNPKTSIPLNVAQLLQTLDPILSQQTKKTLTQKPPQEQATLFLGSPEMMYR